MSDGRQLAILVNPAAAGGRPQRLLPDLEGELRRRGLGYRIVQTTDLDHAAREAKAAAEAGETPVAMGGDGFIGAVAGALAGGGAALGVVPGGRGNDFARVMRIPRDMDGAAEVLSDGKEQAIDMGEVNGRRFLCIASAGLDSDANRIANRARLVRGNLVYAYAAIRALIAWKPARFTVVANGERHEFTGYSVAAANGKAYGGGMFLAPGAKLDDGLFDVVMIGHIGKWKALSNLPKVFKGGHAENDWVQLMRTTELELSADRPFDVYADGECLAQLPATIRVLPGALRVIAPL